MKYYIPFIIIIIILVIYIVFRNSTEKFTPTSSEQVLAKGILLFFQFEHDPTFIKYLATLNNHDNTHDILVSHEMYKKFFDNKQLTLEYIYSQFTQSM